MEGDQRFDALLNAADQITAALKHTIEVETENARLHRVLALAEKVIAEGTTKGWQDWYAEAKRDA